MWSKNARECPKIIPSTDMSCKLQGGKNLCFGSKFSKNTTVCSLGLSNEIQIGISYGIQPQKGLRVQGPIIRNCEVLSFVQTKREKTNGQDMVTQRNIGKVLTGGRRWWKSWWGKVWQNSVSTMPWNLPLLYELRGREINYLCMSYLIIFIPLKTMESSTCQWNLCLQTRFISCLIGWVVVPGLISIVCEEANGNVPYIRVNHP